MPEAPPRALPGSSPHTRGAPTRHILSAYGTRIIPAYAGSTQAFGYPQATQKDHPRIRGEHGIDILGRRVAKGSSPHTRGALAGLSGDLAPLGIIPAYAGSTLF